MCGKCVVRRRVRTIIRAMGGGVPALAERARIVLGLGLAVLMAWVLYAYVFLWHNTPDLAALVRSILTSTGR